MAIAKKKPTQREDRVTRLLSMVETIFMRGVDRALVAVTAAIVGAIETTGDLPSAIDGFEERILQLVESSLDEVLDLARNWNEEDLYLDLDLDRIFTETGLMLGGDGQVSPLARLPAVIRNKDISLEDLILRMSPLIYIAGETLQTQQTPVHTLIRPERAVLRSSRPTFRDDGLNSSQNPGFRSRARAAVREFFGASFLRSVMSTHKSRGLDAARRVIGARLGTRGKLRTRLQLIMQHKAAEMLEADRQADYEKISLIEGYQLLSVLLPKGPGGRGTRDSHRARHKWKFYKDDRPEANLPWEQRIIPPYDHGCLCFTRPIWGKSVKYVPWYATGRFRHRHEIKLRDVGAWFLDGGEFRRVNANHVGRKFPSQPSFGVRDIALYEQWFNEQSLEVRSMIMGERPFLALQSIGVTSPNYKHFVTDEGLFLEPQFLLGESESDRKKRIAAVSRQITAQTRHHELTLTNKRLFKKSQAEEEERRRRLKAFISRHD